MREIVLDTETTGLDLTVDRIIEIGCVELINHIPSGRTFQAYINPQRSISIDSFRVHGLSDDFLAKHPVFAAIADEFLGFIEDAPLIAHNADFDLGFLNGELGRLGRQALGPGRVVDSLSLARRRFPAGPNSLDALCSRFGVDHRSRTLHGALVDATLLAEIYIELIGGRQASLALGDVDGQTRVNPSLYPTPRVRPVPRELAVSAEELAAHRAFIGAFAGQGLWMEYLGANSNPAAVVS
jgi:DNA polymerase III subunit epsilon